MENNANAVIAPGKKDLGQLITQMKPAFESAIGNAINAERFVRVCLTVVKRTPKLLQCDPTTVLGGLMQAAQLNLDFTNDEVWLIPRKNGKTGLLEANFQMGYKGLIELFYRHPLAAEVYPDIVYERDTFRISRGTDRKIVHEEPIKGERGEPIGYYCVARLKSGAMHFEYMSHAEMERHRLHYAPGDYTAWTKSRDAYLVMAMKTVLARTLKWMPKSVEMAVALADDYATKRIPNIEEAKELKLGEIPTFYDDTPPTQEVNVPESAPEPASAKRGRPRKAEPAPPTEAEAPAAPATSLDRRVAAIDTIENSDAPEEMKDAYLSAVRGAEHLSDVVDIMETFRLQLRERHEER